MVTTRKPRKPIDLASKREQKGSKTPANGRKTAGAIGQTSVKELRDSKWWYDRYFERGMETNGNWNLSRLSGWCRGRGYLGPEDSVPHIRTLERWSAREGWVEKRQADQNELAERAATQIREGLALKLAGRYKQAEKVADDVARTLELYLNVPEYWDEAEAKWKERANPYEQETRPTRLRPRLPSEFGRESGNRYTIANLERVFNVYRGAMEVVQKALPASITEEEKDEERMVIRVMARDQVNEIAAGFGELMKELKATTDRRQRERGLNAFGEPINQEEQEPKDMLALDAEQGPVDDDDDEWEEIEVDDPNTLPPGVYMTPEGEILPVGGPNPDDEGEWDSGE